MTTYQSAEVGTTPAIGHAALPPVPFFICSRCEKPFVQEESRNRHLRYCGVRQRRRPRSCQACSIAKSKCNFETPCTRCLKKGLECVYNKSSGIERQHRLNHSATFCTEANKHPSATLALTIDDYVHLRVQNATTAGSEAWVFPGEQEDRSLTLSNTDYFSPSKLTAQIPSFEDAFIFDDLFGFDDASGYLKHTEAQVISNESHAKELFAHWCMWMMRRDASLLVVTENSAVEPDCDGLAALKIARPHAQQNAELIIQSLRSLPLKMQRRETFPWFVHPQSYHMDGSGRSSLPEALSTCMSIAQIFASSTDETKPFVWRTIRTECRSFVSEMQSMSKHEVLSAIQACMIYLIMYIVDYAPEYEGHGRELLMTLNDLYCLFKKRASEINESGQSSSTTSAWQDWIFDESQRRLAILWFLFGCVVYVKNGATYDETQSYRSIALPSPKSLWEAATEATWEREYDATRSCHGNNLKTLGDLMDAQRSQHIRSNARKLDAWNAGVDNLGSLLNLVNFML